MPYFTESPTRKYHRMLSFSAILAFCSLLISLLHGTAFISTQKMIHILLLHPDSDPATRSLLLTLRLPRTLAAFVTGGLLALAGSLMQVLLRNPLADPYILGISGGASLGALFAMLIGTPIITITIFSWAGSLFAIFCVWQLSFSRHTTTASSSLLLTGIAMASIFSAGISLIFILSPEKRLHGMLFWLMGDLSVTHLPFYETGMLLVGIFISRRYATEITLFIRGKEEAQALGIHPQQLSIKLYLLASLLTATAVTLAGCIGFIGLIIPHIVRLSTGYAFRHTLISTVLMGGSLLTLADTLGNTLFAPRAIPAGMIMTFIGVPIFLWLLRKNLNSH